MWINLILLTIYAFNGRTLSFISKGQYKCLSLFLQGFCTTITSALENLSKVLGETK